MLFKIFFEILMKVLPKISEDIREKIKEFLTDLEAKAKETPNPWDDILVLLLRIFTGF